MLLMEAFSQFYKNQRDSFKYSFYKRQSFDYAFWFSHENVYFDWWDSRSAHVVGLSLILNGSPDLKADL